MNFDIFEQIFLHLLGVNLPALIALVAGVVMTCSNWHRHPPSARWALLGFVWMLATYLLAICWHSFLSHIVLGIPRQLEDETPYLFAMSCCEALGYLFLMQALNAARTPYRLTPEFDDFDDTDFSGSKPR